MKAKFYMSVWPIGWLFSIGFLQLEFWQGVWALFIWPYYLGTFIRTIVMGLLIALTLASSPPALAGPEDAVVRLISHGGSGTIIATGDGWTYILSCAHCFKGADRSKPIALDMLHPSPGQPQKISIAVVAVEHMSTGDLALLKLNVGPMPYVNPIAPRSYRGQECWSIGFDEMKLPAQKRPAKVLGVERDVTWTDARPWHGRSGGGLIDKQTGQLIGVVSAYTGPRNRAEYHPGEKGVYASLPAIHAFLAKNGVMAPQPRPPDLGTPSPFIQTQPKRPANPWECPGGTCPTPGAGGR